MEIVKNPVRFARRIVNVEQRFDSMDRTSITACPFVQRFEAALARRVEVRVFAANPGRTASTEAEVLQVNHLIVRLRGGVVRRSAGLLIVCAAKIRLIMGAGMVRRVYVRVLCEHGRGDGGGKNEGDTEYLDFAILDFASLDLGCDHLGFLRLR
jgi:hypothetical protein